MKIELTEYEWELLGCAIQYYWENTNPPEEIESTLRQILARLRAIEHDKG